MIYDCANLDMPLEVEADLCVIGSGAGGLTAATIAAEAGLRVVLLEAGSFVPPEAMMQREEEMIPQLLWDHGGRTTADRAVKIIQGRALGGSTVHNINLVKRVPQPVLRRWLEERGLEHLSMERWDAHYTEVERLLSVSVVPEARRNRHNRLLEAGCQALGWAGGGLSHNRTGCIGSGFCELGCAYDAKNNAPKVFLPRAVHAGARVLTHVQAVRVRHAHGAATGVDALALDPVTRQPRGRVTVRAPRVCVAASATGTPAILLRSDIPDPGGETGRHLRVHPALVAAGEFADRVGATQGIPQTYECTEHLDFEREGLGTRSWILPAFAHPVGTATLMPGIGAAHRTLMQRYDHLAVFTSMLHDRTAGVVEPKGDLGLSIDYWPDAEDRRELLFGLKACARLLFAAGAQKVYIPTAEPLTLESQSDLPRLDALRLTRGSMDVTAVHPMGSVPMGDDPTVAAVDSRGAHHHLRGLWVADGSLFPSSIGVPPQLSIYAMGLHVGRAIVAARG